MGATVKFAALLLSVCLASCATSPDLGAHMEYLYDDGGRAEAGYRGRERDCVARAVAIASRLPYQEIYQELVRIEGTRIEGSRLIGGSKRRVASARSGIRTDRQAFREYMSSLGFRWTPTTYCRTHLRADELPSGRLVVAVSQHYTSVVDGVIRDTYDPSRMGARCVEGYWSIPRKLGLKEE